MTEPLAGLWLVVVPVNPCQVLRVRVSASGSQKRAAPVLGLTQGQISALLNGRKRFTAAILAKLGLERIIVQIKRRWS